MTAILLIIANIALFLTLKLMCFFSPALADAALGALALPADVASSAAMPWTAVTYMFVHIEFWHLLVNVLWLAWFGAVLGHVAGGRWVLFIYISGGIAGAVSYMLFAGMLALTPDDAIIGASAATLSVVAATLVATPDRRVELPFIGKVPLKWLAAGGLAVFVCASLDMSVAQTAAHTGGLIAGVASALMWRVMTRRRMVVMKALARDTIARRSLVEKARRSGYASLTPAERVQLFNLSSRTGGHRAPAQ